MLSSVLDTGMTQKMVRLGSRSADERISKFSIESLEMVQGKSRLDRTFGHHHRELKEVEEEIRKLMSDFVKVEVHSSSITQYLELQYPEHHEHIINPPAWISTIKLINFDADSGDWKQVGKRGHQMDADKSMYAFWRAGEDMAFIDALSRQAAAPSPVAAPPDIQNRNAFSLLDETHEELSNADVGDANGVDDDSSDVEEEEEDSVEERWKRIQITPEPKSPQPMASPLISTPELDPREPEYTPSEKLIRPTDIRDPMEFFSAHGCDDIPIIWTSDRSLETLLEFGDIWAMSLAERHRLHGFWTQMVRNDLHQNQLEDFERLRRKHSERLRTFNEGKDEVENSLTYTILESADLINLGRDAVNCSRT